MKLLLLSLIKGYTYIVKSLQRFSLVMGIVGGVIGLNYDDYQSIHGQ